MRSMPELERYLKENPNIKCDRSVTNTTRPQNLQTITQTPKSMPKNMPKSLPKNLDVICDKIVTNIMKTSPTSIPEVKYDKNVKNTTPTMRKILPKPSKNSNTNVNPLRNFRRNNDQKNSDVELDQFTPNNARRISTRINKQTKMTKNQEQIVRGKTQTKVTNFFNKFQQNVEESGVDPLESGVDPLQSGVDPLQEDPFGNIGPSEQENTELSDSILGF